MVVEGPGEDEILGLIDLVRRHFEFVVVDGGNALSPHLKPLLTVSDHRLMVVTPDLPALRNLKRAFEFDERTNGKPTSTVVLNKYKEGVGLSTRDVEDGLGHRIDLILEKDDLRVLESINLGRPEVLVGRSRFAKQLMSFAKRLLGPSSSGAVSTPRKGLMSWVRRIPGVPKEGRKEARK
jgi:pilus assembly protein CpaE